MFRSLALLLNGSENNHDAVRTVITRFENLNRERFKCLLFADKNEPTIEDHINKLLHPATWGTHIELVAITTFLQIPAPALAALLHL